MRRYAVPDGPAAVFSAVPALDDPAAAPCSMEGVPDGAAMTFSVAGACLLSALSLLARLS